MNQELIRHLEMKMLPDKNGKRKTREQPAMMGLSRGERILYAQNLEETGQLKAAAVFRNYVDPPPEQPKEPKLKKQTRKRK